MVLQGAAGKIRQRLLASTRPVARVIPEPITPAVAEESAVTSSAIADIDASLLKERIQMALNKTVSALLKIRPEDLNGDAELSEFGFDSVTLTEFGNLLNKAYQIALSPTIFFEYPTLNSIAEYLSKEHRDVFTASLVHVESVRQGEKAQMQRRSPPVGPASEVGMSRTGMPRQPSRSSIAAVGFRPEATKASTREPIAIIGMSGCFPMARDVEAFWDNLLGEKDCISEIPANRWDWREVYGDAALQENKTKVKWGGFIEGVEEFDPLFFGISPKEAEVMDPQQRLLMMHVWRAIEDAGYAASSLSGSRTAIYVGTGSTGYSRLLAQSSLAIEGYSATAMVPSVGPNRMSYMLNLHGPSEPVETACSSSLIALRKGVMAIESGGCELAIVGGVNTIVTPEAHISFSKAGMLAEDGRCKSFSAQANGYVRGEGVGMLVLKRLSAAQRDGDHIYGVILGTAENHGGRATSLTAPNPKAQASLLEEAYRQAGVDPRSIGYIEAHGTGTPLGDPIEVNGLKMAFKSLYEGAGAPVAVQPHCGLGSVKTNIGHLELAAGVAGVIKVLLQMQHKTLLKSLHCQEVNPYIQLEGSPFYMVQETGEWKALQDELGRELPRRAGVSSFGFGGVNAHVVIEEYRAQRQDQVVRAVSPQNPALVVLSAKDDERLQAYAQQLLEAIKRHGWGDEVLLDLAYTLQVGRDAMDDRLALVVSSMEQLRDKLESFVAGKSGIEELYRGQARKNREALASLASDDDMTRMVDAWLAKGKLHKVVDLWVKGLAFDWSKLYDEHHRPRRMSLPSYPFAREQYWVSGTGRRSNESYAMPTGKNLHAVPKAEMGFDEAHYLQLLDRVIDGSVSIDAAVQQIDA
jgi:polyketide synthase PksN